MPLLITQEQYNHAMLVIDNKKEMIQFFQDLKEWILQQYDINVIDFIIEDSFCENKKRICMLINKSMNYQKNSYRKKLKQINEKMMELCEVYDFMSLDKLDPSIGFYDFRPIYKAECVNIASKQAISFLKNKYVLNNIFNIIYSGYGNVTVFYTLKKDTENNKMTGISDEIKKDFYKILEPLDKFHLIKYDESYITFDSKEVLDFCYNGNLYDYYR